jgi:hypothetical protein
MGLWSRLFSKPVRTGMPDEASSLWAQGDLAPSLLDEWRWLVSDRFTPILCTACGDLFLQTREGAVYFLDSATGSLLSAASSAEQLDELAGEHFDAWWKPALMAAAQKRTRPLATGECYGWSLAPRLGGRNSADNLTPRTLGEHFAALGRAFNR